jgi:hypothetical protein
MSALDALRRPGVLLGIQMASNPLYWRIWRLFDGVIDLLMSTVGSNAIFAVTNPEI